MTYDVNAKTAELLVQARHALAPFAAFSHKLDAAEADLAQIIEQVDDQTGAAIGSMFINLIAPLHAAQRVADAIDLHKTLSTEADQDAAPRKFSVLG